MADTSNSSIVDYLNYDKELNIKQRRKFTKELNLFLKKYGFYKTGQSTWIKEYPEVIDIIYIQYTSTYFHCDIAVQPLCIEKESKNIDIGNRIRFYKPETWRMTYIYLEEDFVQTMIYMQDILMDRVIPWFDEVNTCKKLVEFLEMENNPRKDYAWVNNRTEKMAFMHAYLCNKEIALKYLEEYRQILIDHEIYLESEGIVLTPDEKESRYVIKKQRIKITEEMLTKSEDIRKEYYQNILNNNIKNFKLKYKF